MSPEVLGLVRLCSGQWPVDFKPTVFFFLTAISLPEGLVLLFRLATVWSSGLLLPRTLYTLRLPFFFLLLQGNNWLPVVHHHPSPLETPACQPALLCPPVPAPHHTTIQPNRRPPHSAPPTRGTSHHHSPKAVLSTHHRVPAATQTRERKEKKEISTHQPNQNLPTSLPASQPARPPARSTSSRHPPPPPKKVKRHAFHRHHHRRRRSSSPIPTHHDQQSDPHPRLHRRPPRHQHPRHQRLARRNRRHAHDQPDAAAAAGRRQAGAAVAAAAVARVQKRRQRGCGCGAESELFGGEQSGSPSEGGGGFGGVWVGC